MSIFNRRNALLGWLAWIGAKQVLRKKAREAVPGTVEGSKRPNKGAIAAALAAAAGVLLFWRRQRSADDELPPPAGE
jgi:MYXO-CTERM domain-containing protein